MPVQRRKQFRTDIVLERLTSILCVSFARFLRIFEAVASTENYQTFLLPKFNVVAEPAIRSHLKVEVIVYEIVAALALPVQSAFDWCPYYCHINHIYHIFNNTRKGGLLVGSHARFLEAPESSSSSSRQALTHSEDNRKAERNLVLSQNFEAALKDQALPGHCRFKSIQKGPNAAKK